MKNKKNISDNTLNIIVNNHLKPFPKWEYVLKNWFVYLSFILFFALLTIGISISWFGLIEGTITPYFWLFLVVFFSVLSYYFFKKTKKSYRYQKRYIIISILLASSIFGITLFKTGFARKIDQSLEKNISQYRHLVPLKMETWTRPQEGFLSGTIIEVTSNNNFSIQDFEGNLWTISSDDLITKGRLQIKTGISIKLIGQQVSDKEFFATEIRPWSGNLK